MLGDQLVFGVGAGEQQIQLLASGQLDVGNHSLGFDFKDFPCYPLANSQYTSVTG